MIISFIEYIVLRLVENTDMHLAYLYIVKHYNKFIILVQDNSKENILALNQ